MRMDRPTRNAHEARRRRGVDVTAATRGRGETWKIAESWGQQRRSEDPGMASPHEEV